VRPFVPHAGLLPFAWKQGETRPVRLRAAGSSSRRSPV